MDAPRRLAGESTPLRPGRPPIIATGARLVHPIDGKVFCDVEDTDPAAPRKGSIVFGNAGGTTVDFKDAQLKRIFPPR